MAGVPPPSVAKVAARSFQFERARVRWPEWVVALSALVLLIVMFVMNWYTVDVPTDGLTGLTPQESVNGWDGISHLRWLILVTIISAFALFLLQATRRAPAMPATLSLVVMLLGGLTVVWLFVRVAIDPPGGRCPGGWVGLVAAAVLTWGSFRSLRMEGILPTDAPAHIPTVTLPPPDQAPPPDESPPSADRS